MYAKEFQLLPATPLIQLFCFSPGLYRDTAWQSALILGLLAISPPPESTALSPGPELGLVPESPEEHWAPCGVTLGRALPPCTSLLRPTLAAQHWGCAQDTETQRLWAQHRAWHTQSVSSSSATQRVQSHRGEDATELHSPSLYSGLVLALK